MAASQAPPRASVISAPGRQRCGSHGTWAQRNTVTVVAAMVSPAAAPKTHGAAQAPRGCDPPQQERARSAEPLSQAGQPCAVADEFGQCRRAHLGARQLGQVGLERVVQTHLAALGGVRQQETVERLRDRSELVPAARDADVEDARALPWMLWASGK